MFRRSLYVLLILSGCASDPDTRPATFQVVTQEILMPTCGQVQCHSSTTAVRGFAFDTLVRSRFAMDDMGVPLSISSGRPRANQFYQVLDGERTKMPPDSPLSDQDMRLIETWLDNRAPGL